MGSQRVGHDRRAELNWTELSRSSFLECALYKKSEIEHVQHIYNGVTFMQEWVLQSSSKTAICLRQHYQWGVVVLPSKCKTQILIKSKAELFPSVSFCNSHAASPEIVRIGLILIGENPLSIFFQSLSQFSCVRCVQVCSPHELLYARIPCPSPTPGA